MRRTLGIAAATVAALVVIGGVVVWSGVRGDHARRAAEERLTRMLGRQVTIGEVGLSLTPTLTMSGRDVRIGDAGAAAPGLRIERVVIRPRLAPLLRRTLVIEDIELRGFVVSLLRDAKGGWHAPPLAPADAGGSSSGDTIERVRVVDGRVRVVDALAGGELRETASIDAIAATIQPADAGLRVAPISGRIGTAGLTGEARTTERDVQLEFTAENIADGDLPALLGLLGVERPAFLKLGEKASVAASVSVNRSSAQLSGRGKLVAPEVLLEPLRLQQLQSPFTIANKRLHFSPVTFRVAGGAHTGVIDVRFGPPRWSIDSRVSSMDVKRFLNTLTGRDQRVEGTAAITAALGGRVDEPLVAGAEGQLDVGIVDGVIRDFALLAALDRALKLTAQQGSDTAFERLTGRFQIGGAAARTNDLLIVARDVQLRASGRIGADRSLDMRGLAILSPERSAQAITSIKELKGMRNDNGQVQVPLTISGSLDSPEFNVDMASILRKGALDELNRQLRRIIR